MVARKLRSGVGYFTGEVKAIYTLKQLKDFFDDRPDEKIGRGECSFLLSRSDCSEYTVCYRPEIRVDMAE